MLRRLRIKNIALIDELECEFGEGLNVLTGETGSGKSIIVDSLNALTGERVYSELIRDGATSAVIEGDFRSPARDTLAEAFRENEMDLPAGDAAELTVRREISLTGRNRVFVNDQLATQGFLKRIGGYLVNIHGQGEQTMLYDVSSHLTLLDRSANNDTKLGAVADAFRTMSGITARLADVQRDASERLQLVDILTYQINEIRSVDPQPGEDAELEAEKLRLNNSGKLTALSDEIFQLLYEGNDSTLSTLARARQRIEELSAYDDPFREFLDGIDSADAVIKEAAIAARDLGSRIEFSPERLEQIEDRLAAIAQLTRKYGGTIENVLSHLETSAERLAKIETSELTEKELKRELSAAFDEYLGAAQALHDARIAAAKKFEKRVVEDLGAVALDKAKFEVRVDAPTDPKSEGEDSARLTANGFDRVEFYFSANPGEPVKPLSKVVSGGEASRLMLILKTASKNTDEGSAAVFDEIDAGVGGRVAEAVGRKLKDLAATQQVLCVTHQAQIASQADRHFVVEKTHGKSDTSVRIFEIGDAERIEEIARMLAGEEITDAARQNARSMLAAAS